MISNIHAEIVNIQSTLDVLVFLVPFCIFDGKYRGIEMYVCDLGVGKVVTSKCTLEV